MTQIARPRYKMDCPLRPPSLVKLTGARLGIWISASSACKLEAIEAIASGTRSDLLFIEATLREAFPQRFAPVAHRSPLFAQIIFKMKWKR